MKQRQGQRGSAAVIAIIVMMFLLIVGIGWLPMLVQENTAASHDERDQQAWYAEEAGFNRLKVEAANTGTDFTWGWLSTDKTKSDLKWQDLEQGKSNAQYAVYVEPNLTGTNKPTAGSTYAVTAVGRVGDYQKVIKRELTIPSDSGSGGSGGETNVLPGAIQAGGTVTIENSNNEIIGKIYGKDFIDKTGNQIPTNNGIYGGKYEADLLTNIPEAVFKISSYDNFEYVDIFFGASLYLETNNNYILEWGKLLESKNYNKITGEKNSLFFINTQRAILLTTWNGIIGPTGGKPLTIIFNSNDVTIDSQISGDVMIITKGNVTIGNKGDVRGRVCVLADGNVYIYPTIREGLIYSKKDVVIDRSCQQFIGQIAAKGNVTIATASLKFSNSIAKSGDFTFPAGIK